MVYESRATAFRGYLIIKKGEKMNSSRRKFIRKSLLLGSGVSFAGYVLSKNISPMIQKINHNTDNNIHATYKNTKHNRQFYTNARF